MQRPTSVIFWDFDGTLATRAGRWSGALVEALTSHDPACGVTRAQLAPYIRDGFPWHTPDLPHLDRCKPDDWWSHLQNVFRSAYEAIGLPTATATALARQVRQYYVDPGGWSVYANAVPMLTALAAQGWRHIILSNHVPELPALVAALGLGPLVDHVLSSTRVGYEKPHPEIFRRALHLAGHPDTVWMVGDNVVADVLGAEHVGIPAILVRQEDTRARRHAGDLYGVVSLMTEGDPGGCARPQ